MTSPEPFDPPVPAALTPSREAEDLTGPLPELAFVCAPGQSLFFTELAAALRAEAEGLGARTSIHVGNFPTPRRDLIYVLVSAHEYYALMDGRIGPPPEAHARTLLICAEQPGSPFFEHNLRLARGCGAVFDIDRRAVRAFAREGVGARYLQLGWTAAWDQMHDGERDIDVLFMGYRTERRERALARYAQWFWRRRVAFVLSEGPQPTWRATAGFRAGRDKWDLLSRSKVLINLHQSRSESFEWLRVAQAMSTGAVVVSEHSVDMEPLVCDQHLLAGAPESLALLTEMLLDDGERLETMRRCAYDFLRSHVPLADAVRHLLRDACAVARCAPVATSEHPFFGQPQPDPARIPGFHEPDRPPSPAQGDHNAAVLRRAAKDLKLDLIDIRRAQARLEWTAARGSVAPVLTVRRCTSTYWTVRPRISVLLTLFNYEEYVTGALDSLLVGHEPSWEVVIVDDASSDASADRALAWMNAHPDVAATLLAHPVNRGLAHARNAALGWARGELCFVLDADNEIYPHCLERLAEALDSDPAAAFAYGIFERFDARQTIGLLNTLPWEPRRLRMGNQIDAMALIRTRVLRDLGGYTVERRLFGWEDYELWCRLAENGGYGAFVPEIVARYRATDHSMLSVTNVSATDAFSLIFERAPRLMAGMRAPD